MYLAIEDIRNLTLFIRRADDHEHQEKLDSIATRLGIEGETILVKEAEEKGIYFFPKYLNDIIHEDIDDFRVGAAIGDGGRHFPDPRSHGQ